VESFCLKIEDKIVGYKKTSHGTDERRGHYLFLTPKLLPLGAG
jgi:hypothetical protein